MALDDKVRKYRIVIHNLNADDETVTEIVREELGQVEIVDWFVERYVHYEAKIPPGFENMPQREIIVGIEYRDAK